MKVTKIKTLKGYFKKFIFIVPIILVATVLIGESGLVHKRFLDYEKEARETYITDMKDQVKREVEQAAQIIKALQQDARLTNEFEQQEMAIQILERLLSEDVEYIFAGSYDGTAILGPAKGRNMIDVEDINGKKIVQELIHAAKSGGGYVEYVMPDLEGVEQTAKISYALGIEEWEWYIGTGRNIDEIENIIAHYRDEAIREHLINIVFFLIASGLLFGVLFSISNRFYTTISQAIEKFSAFFVNAASGDQAMDINALEFQEFKDIGGHANTMLHKRVEQEKKLTWHAYHDNLTTLPNRLFLYKKLKKQCEETAILQTNTGAIMLIDIDNFKSMNDTFGHAFGDQLLIQIGERLRTTFPERMVARFGDDEFAMLVQQRLNKEEIEELAEQVLYVLQQPILIRKSEISITSSIGIAIIDDDCSEPSDIMKYADIAMYEAKSRGKNCYTFFAEDMFTATLASTNLEIDLKNAIRKKEFVLYYQPIYNMQDGSLKGLEALIRWQRFEGVFISPSEFIPIAERIGLIYEIGTWVLEEACRFSRTINDQSKRPISVSINISAMQLMNTNFIENTLDIIRRHHIQPEHIVFEITETALMESFDINTDKLRQLHEMGYGIALDDFGTGYSSLNYLIKLPVNFIKIDKSFVDEIVHNKKYQKINNALIDISHDLNLEIIAEGVEYQEQYDLLVEMGCDYMQGFLRGKPVAEIDVKDYLVTNQREG